MAKEYYDILGVSKTASEEEIKRAYRKLAHQHHPDKGGSKERFQEINEAYQVLGDKNKRAQYDQFGSVGGNSPFGGQAGGNPFGAQGGSPFGGAGGVKFDFGSAGGFGSIFEDLFEGAFSQVQVQMTITIPQAVLGDTLRFKTQLGDELELRIPPGVQEETTFRFRGKGQQTRRGRGDLQVSIHIKIPNRLSREEKELYERLKDLGR
ncbi:MAG TPA: DnaJ domain-containing protein [Candidatus Saccharimonadales bacterium]|nr:DnaJ domain-containing protein [Candidatus Saccharimonadales bacterium]